MHGNQPCTLWHPGVASFGAVLIFHDLPLSSAATIAQQREEDYSFFASIAVLKIKNRSDSYDRIMLINVY